MSFRNSIRQWTDAEIRKYPCAFSAFGILFAIIGYYSIFRESENAVLMTSFLCVQIIVLFFPFVSIFNLTFRFGLPILVSLISISKTVWNRPSLSEELIPNQAFVQTVIRVADSSCSPTLVEIGQAQSIRCEIISYRWTKNDSWKSCKDTYVMMYLPTDFHCGWDDYVYAEGVLSYPNSPIFDFSFDYGSYLRRKGISYLFSPRQCTLQIKGHSPYRGLLNIRDEVIQHTVCKIKNEKMRNLAVGILFGFRGGMSHDIRDIFIQSGTIHILTVSGTHIGIFSLWILLLFRLLPFKIRWIPALFFTQLYAVSTGMHESAIRAFFMCSIFLVLNACLLSSITLNTLYFAACMIMIYSPASVYSQGFQYSFITTGFLMCTANRVKKFSSLVCESVGQRFVPWKYVSAYKVYYMTGKRRFVLSMCSCFIAFISTLSVVIHYQGICPVGSIVANLLIIPLTGLIFQVFLMSMPFCMIPGVNQIAPEILSFLLRCVYGICSFFSRHSVTVRPIPLVMVILFFLIIILFLFLDQIRYRMYMLILSIILFFIWDWQPYLLDSEILVLRGGNRRHVALMVYNHRNRSAYQVNILDEATNRIARDFLKDKGLSSYRRIYMTSTKMQFNESISADLKVVPADEIIYLEKKHNFLKNNLKSEKKQDINVYSLSDSVNELFFVVFPDTENRAEEVMLIKEYGSPKEKKKKISAVFSLYPQVVHLNYDTIEENP